mmetsp:Transcript_39003/g.69886  ORF Transcript_39003/g.69886 Transcript_39003/m.69886 type:complete len:417 (-) Transcript_39003:76-1326(-)
MWRFLQLLGGRRLGLILLLLVHGHAVQQRTEDGHRGAQPVEESDGVLEKQDGADHHRHALHGVADAERRGRQATVQHHVGELVVEMIKDAREREELQKLALSQRAHSHLPGDVPLGGLHNERERDAVNARNDGQQAKEIHAVDVLLLHVTGEALLGEDVAKDHAKVGGHGEEEASPRKGELLHGGEGAAGDDGDEGGPHVGGRPGSQKRTGQGDREHRLSRLHDVRKGDGHQGEGDAGGDVTHGVGKCHGQQPLDELHINLGLFLKTSRPHRAHPHARHDQLHGGHKVRAREGIQGALVQNVEDHVERIPEKNIESGFGHDGQTVVVSLGSSRGNHGHVGVPCGHCDAALAGLRKRRQALSGQGRQGGGSQGSGVDRGRTISGRADGGGSRPAGKGGHGGQRPGHANRGSHHFVRE